MKQDFDFAVFEPFILSVPVPPALKSAVSEKKRPRQWAYMRVMGVLAIVLVAAVLALGTAEIVAHGWMFFVYRSPGTGSTPGG